MRCRRMVGCSNRLGVPVFILLPFLPVDSFFFVSNLRAPWIGFVRKSCVPITRRSSVGPLIAPNRRSQLATLYDSPLQASDSCGGESSPLVLSASFFARS